MPTDTTFALRIESAFECIDHGAPLNNRVLADAGWEWATFQDTTGSFPAYRAGPGAEWVDANAAKAATTEILAHILGVVPGRR